MANENSTPQKWAVLIGINCYIDGLETDHLTGCVGDILIVEEYLLGEQGFVEDHIIKLTASRSPNEGDPVPTEPEEQWPTYDNIVNALKTVTKKASPGDLVYFHYSGHGFRARTLYKELKGMNAYDESIVPTDCRTNGRFLRDVEMAYFLQQLVDKEVVLTVVLDSCHSAGAVRDTKKKLISRGLTNVNDEDISTEKLDVPHAALSRAWGKQKPQEGMVKQNWMLEPYGFELLAACRADQSALEAPIGKANAPTGLLTWSLLNALQSGGQGLTHKMLYRRINDDIQRKIEYLRDLYKQNVGDQEPILSGNGSRYFLSQESAAQYMPSIDATRPFSYKDKHSMVRLNGGAAHGVCLGAEYLVYPWNWNGTGDRLAKVVVTDVSPVTSEAYIIGNPVPVWDNGAQAVLMRKPTDTKTRIKYQHSANISQDIPQKDMLDKLRQIYPQIVQNSVAPLALFQDGEEGSADYYITVNNRAEYEVLDAEQKPFPNLAPSGDPEAILKCVMHLAQVRAVRDLKNPSPTFLKGKFEFCVLGKETTNGIVEATAREGVTIRFRNLLHLPLMITIFDFGPSWEVSQIYPKSSSYEMVDAGNTRDLQIRLSVPNGLKTADNVFKVFATIKPTSFGALEIPKFQMGSSGGLPGILPDDLAVIDDKTQEIINNIKPQSTVSTLHDDWATGELTVRTSL